MLDFMTPKHEKTYRDLHCDQLRSAQAKQAMYILTYFPTILQRMQAIKAISIDNPYIGWIDFSPVLDGTIHISTGERVLIQLAADLYNGSGNFNISDADYFCDDNCKTLILRAITWHFCKGAS